MRYVLKLLNTFTHPEVVRRVKTWQPSMSSSRNVRPKCIWIVVPYSPSVYGLTSKLHEVTNKWENKKFVLPFNLRTFCSSGDSTSLRQILVVKGGVVGSLFFSLF